MSNFDDIFAPQADSQPGEKPAQETKQDWAARRNQEREAVYAMVDSTTERMAANGEVFQDYLDVQARFDRYSVKNCILITAQNKDATKLATFDDWKADNISIQKGAKGISIMVPDEYRRRDGTPATGFIVGKVFDISQTTAVAAANTVSHDPRRLLEALVRNSPCPVEIRVLTLRAGRFSSGRAWRRTLCSAASPRRWLWQSLPRGTASAANVSSTPTAFPTSCASGSASPRMPIASISSRKS